MRWIVALFITVLAVDPILAQSDLQKLVDTEHLFAQMAVEKGTRAAFLANMTDDALVFEPDKTNAKALWMSRSESQSLLSWAPNYADISANGIMGYTTGNWEYRERGKTDEPSAFGEFVTIWVRQPDGKYKWVIDVGVGHEKPAKYSTDWITSSEKIKDPNEKNSSAADNVSGFYTAITDRGIGNAYNEYAVDDLRSFRENKLPILGKKELASLLKKDKATFSFAKRSTFFGSADISYSTNTYSKTISGKVVEKGNTMQIWKLIKGRWKIVLDIFKPVP